MWFQILLEDEMATVWLIRAEASTSFWLKLRKSPPQAQGLNRQRGEAGVLVSASRI
jgi:hypothetical protein